CNPASARNFPCPPSLRIAAETGRVLSAVGAERPTEVRCAGARPAPEVARQWTDRTHRRLRAVSRCAMILPSFPDQCRILRHSTRKNIGEDEGPSALSCQDEYSSGP